MDVPRSRVGAGRGTARCGIPPCCRGSVRSWPNPTLSLSLLLLLSDRAGSGSCGNAGKPPPPRTGRLPAPDPLPQPLSRGERGERSHDPNAPEDAVARGYGASGTWMCRGRALEQDAEPRDAVYPRAAAAPSGAGPTQRCHCRCCCPIERDQARAGTPGSHRHREPDACRLPTLSPNPSPRGSGEKKPRPESARRRGSAGVWRKRHMDVPRSRVGAGRGTARCGIPPCCRGSVRSPHTQCRCCWRCCWRCCCCCCCCCR